MDSALGRQLANGEVGLGHEGVNAHRCDGVSRYPISACDPRADIGVRAQCPRSEQVSQV